ncbi:hypothetical protein QR680_004749 [Steinernema hermaphroditum]|uniref:Cdc37 N-terminal domain-containing protein n=1 Tax=Steinernema hermaphroditum TaxID=289476 RepID=A0AA39LUH4_9BILA|nr:hypothetical protein QR680_004749 [Steinernema hermaphroditum]
MPMDVSKANGIGVSNNEDDTYPTIGTPSLLLWRHQARLERITNCNKEREKAEQRKEEIQPRLEAIKKKVSTKIANKLFGKLSKEKRSLCAELEKIDKKLTDVEKDYHNLESEVNVEEWLRNEQENVSSLCKEKQDSSKTTEEESRRVADYLRKHEMELKGYGTLRGFERSKTFLLKHPLLCNELAVNFLAIECLNLTIQGRLQDAGHG